MKKPLKISNLPGNRYLQLRSRVRVLLALEQQLEQILPAPLNSHCSTLNLSGTTLILAAESPVWAARLRFHAPQLVKQLSGRIPVDIRAVRIRVKAPQRAVPARPASRPRRSSAGAAALRRTAETIADPELKSGLLKLASRHLGR